MPLIKKILKDLKKLPVFLNALNFKSFLFFLRRPFLIRRSIVQLGAKYTTKNGKLIIQLSSYGVSFCVNSISNIEVIMEIFYEKIYKLNTSEECIAIDIGMNIGVASIYFAMQKNIKNIYSFEPFIETYGQAVYNISLNGKISDKIHPQNCGLSDSNKNLDTYFYSDLSGSMSTSDGNNSHVNISKSKMNKTTIELKSAPETLKTILENNDSKVILKIDCEGSEYEIFEALNKHGLMKKIDYIMLEWHFKGEQPLLDILEQNGFASFSRTIFYDLGLIYAVRKENAI